MYPKTHWFLNGFWMKNWAKMEAPGSQNWNKNEWISWTFRNPLPGALQGRVWGGFWVELGRIFGGFWRDLGGFWEDFQWNLGWFSIEFSKEGLGRVLDGFGEDFGRFLKDLVGFERILNESWEGFWLNFLRFSGILEKPNESRGILANPSESEGTLRKRGSQAQVIWRAQRSTRKDVRSD